MRSTTIGFFIFVAILLINGCTAKPKLKAYVPKENFKVVYVTKDAEPAAVNFPDMDSAKMQPPAATFPEAVTTPRIEITDLITSPNPVMVNQAFDIKGNFQVDLPEKQKKLEVLFHFAISQDDEVLFTSDTITLKATNGLTEGFNAHMGAVPVSGVYEVKAVINHKNFSSEKSIKLTINF